MKFRLLFSALLASACGFLTLAQTAREEVLADPCKAGGIYYAYPGPAEMSAPAPEGFTPFYISHYGRHGSRYLIADEDYARVIGQFAVADSLGYLTPAGKEAYAKLLKVWEEAEGRGGELTPLGARQHKEIARRMFESFPQVFTDSAKITARSTQVMRCAHSMMAFCEGLKELNPALVIPKESSKRWMSHLCWWTDKAAEWNSDRGPWKPAYDAFQKDNIKPERLVNSLFTSTDRLPLSDEDFYWALYWLAVDIQNMETQEDFLSYFSPEELYSLWRVNNLSFYMHNSSYPLSGGLITANARNLLQNIVATADEYIANGTPGATLRFGHDGNITPLAALMKFDGFCGEELDVEKAEDAWKSYRVTPMASNFQAIFFSPADSAPGKNVVVKFMMNEHDVKLPIPYSPLGAPFYNWQDARAFLMSQIDSATTIIKNHDIL